MVPPSSPPKGPASKLLSGSALGPELVSPRDLALDPESDPIELGTRCKACGELSTHEVERVYLHPDIGHLDWDGVLASEILVCPRCGARDDYELQVGSSLRMLGLTLRRTLGGADDGRVVVGACEMWDGTIVRRQWQSVQHLRALAERMETSAEAWRRLGNVCERLGLVDDALEAWLHAFKVDPDEVEAPFSLAQAASDADQHESALRWIGAMLERWPRAPEPKLPMTRQSLAEGIAHTLRRCVEALPPAKSLAVAWNEGETPSGDPIVRMSGVDLERIEDWDALADLLASSALIAAGISDERQSEPFTELGRILGAQDGPPTSWVRLSPRPNDGGRAGRQQEDRRKKRKAAKAARKKNRR